MPSLCQWKERLCIDAEVIRSRLLQLQVLSMHFLLLQSSVLYLKTLKILQPNKYRREIESSDLSFNLEFVQ